MTTFSSEQLNFLKFSTIVRVEFPVALRQVFVYMWDKQVAPTPGFQKWDDSPVVRSMFLSKEGGKTKYIPTSESIMEWDCTALLEATLYGQSFAQPVGKGGSATLAKLYVKPRHLPSGTFHPTVISPSGNLVETIALALDQLRLLRNKLSHMVGAHIDDATLHHYVMLTKAAFSALGLNCRRIDDIAKQGVEALPTANVGFVGPEVETAVTNTTNGDDMKNTVQAGISKVPEYILNRGFIAAYQRALELGETSDKRVKVLLIGQDRVGKTSVGRSLKGEEFNEEESSTEGVQMDEVLKNVGLEPWRNSSEEKEVTSFDHKCAFFVSNELTATSPQEMAHLGPMEPSKSPSTNTPGIENPESKRGMLKVNLPDENPNKGQEKQEVNIPPRIVRLANENLTKNRGDGDDGIWPVIMDFAGQAIYRAIHPIFVSSEAIYVLMFDLTKNLYEIARCRVRETGHGEIHIQAPDSNDTNLDHILRWMDLVHSFKHGADDNILPPVIIVGTKADLVDDPDGIIESLTDTICETTEVFSEHIKETIAVDNTRAGQPHDEEDPNIRNLRNEILKVGEEMPHTKKKVPLKWLKVENKVYELASKGENYITRQNFKKNICDDICQFEPADDFEVLLLFLHDRGTVVYHGYASDPDCLVVLNPKWLIYILCQLITVEKQAKEPIRIRNLRKKLGKSGVLEAELLDHSCKILEVDNIKESLLFIMKKFNLLCEYNCEDGNTIYLVPCMLTSKPKVNLESNIAENKGPAPVFLTFNTQYVPGGLFSSLIVLFVEFASRVTNCRQPELHSNFARFLLGDVTGVEFVCYKRVIKVSIWDHQNSSSDPLDKEPQICLELLRFLQSSLEKLQKECHWMRAVTWDLSARCNLCPAELVTETGECVWHRKQACRREDCAHYVSLTKKTIACSRTEGLDCCPPKTWRQALEDTLAFQALETQPENKSLETASAPPEVTVTLLKKEDLPKKTVPWDHIQLRVDILLLAVKNCEFLACLSYLNPDFFKIYSTALGCVYLGDIGEDKLKLRIAVMKSHKGSGGPGGSAVVVMNAVRVLRPKAVFCVGICGGLNFNKVKLGDVVVLEKLITYAHSKVKENGIEERGVKVPLKPLLSKLTLSPDDGWKAPLKDPKDLKVQVHRGAILSGPEVVDSNERRKALITRFPEAVAIEMEGEGLYAAAHELNIEWIVIKGVSDYADGRKSETHSWRQFASLMAASLTAHILSDHNVFQDWPHYESTNDFVNQRRYEQTATVSPSTSLQDSVPHGEGLRQMKVVKGDSEVEGEVEGEIETKAKKRRPKGLTRIKVVKRDSKVERGIKIKAKKRRLKGLKRMKVVNSDSEVEGEIETTTNKRRLKVKDGIPSDDELEGLSKRIERWKSLGRRLKFDKAVLTGFHKDNEEWSEKAYAMLMAWKEREGVAATYQVLHDALCHDLVNRLDLAQQVCCHYQTRRKCF